MRYRVALSALLCTLSLCGFAAEGQDVIADGRRVSIEFTLTLDDGTQAQSNVGGEPLVYRQGNNELLPALESALAGLSVDARKTVTLTPLQGYGNYDENMVLEVDRAQIPEQSQVVDAMLVATDPSGTRRPVRVREVRGDTVVLDFNHPLAGRSLTFDVHVLDIQ